MKKLGSVSIVLLATLLSASDVRGTVVVVVDQAGAPVVSANVSIYRSGNAARHPIANGKTDSDGKFDAGDLTGLVEPNEEVRCHATKDRNTGKTKIEWKNGKLEEEVKITLDPGVRMVPEQRVKTKTYTVYKCVYNPGCCSCCSPTRRMLRCKLLCRCRVLCCNYSFLRGV